MSCLPCFQNNEPDTYNENRRKNDDLPVAKPVELRPPPPPNDEDDNKADSLLGKEDHYYSTKNFTFRELASATKNFRQECLLGEGGFGRVYKGTLQGTGQIVVVRQLDRNGVHGTPEFVMEVAKLNLMEHWNLVKLVGYCADGDQRLLVYEYMPMGSLKDNLFDLPADKTPLDWTTRMKIASGIADGLKYLHEKVDPPVIYRDLKSSNILLDEGNCPRLSKYGLANLVQGRNKMNISPTVVTSNGYSAPECEINGEMTAKSDIYSFGVILLELISGRKAFDPTLPIEEQNLVNWARPIFHDQTRLIDIADPLLKNRFPKTSLNQAVGVTAMCLQEEPSARPLVSDISSALSFLARAPPEAPIPDELVPMLSTRVLSVSQYEYTGSFTDCNKQQHISESNDEVSEINPDNDEDRTSSSDYEYGDSSDSSDYEGSSKNLDRCDESKKLSSRSKRKSTKEPHRNSSRTKSSRSSRHRSSRRKSKSCKSLRCETSEFPDTEQDEENSNDQNEIQIS